MMDKTKKKQKQVWKTAQSSRSIMILMNYQSIANLYQNLCAQRLILKKECGMGQHVTNISSSITCISIECIVKMYLSMRKNFILHISKCRVVQKMNYLYRQCLFNGHNDWLSLAVAWFYKCHLTSKIFIIYHIISMSQFQCVIAGPCIL